MPRCYANPDPSFQPAMRLIASITNANPAVVTTTFAHDYISGIIVRLNIPVAVGMQQANGKQGTITVTGDTTFTINIDTTNFETFFIDDTLPAWINICANVVPIGEINSTLRASTRNVLPGGSL